MKKFLLACAWWLATIGHAQLPDAPAADDARARIARDRADANARYATQEAQCYQKFAVNDCLENARQLRRQSLGVLSREEMGLNEARRRETGAARLRSIEEKSRADTERMAEGRNSRAQAPDAKRSERLRGNAAAVPTDAAVSAPQNTAPRKTKSKKPIKTAAETAQTERAFQKKQLEAAKRREALARKEALRTKPPAAPLPPAQ